jgi:hypothetical protein
LPYGVGYQVSRQNMRCPYQIFERLRVGSTPAGSEDYKNA